MPQMAPYNWLYLFILFNLVVLTIITHTHFSSFTPTPFFKLNLNKLNFKFKW
uniref:ATP synthase F0 subunit 8 n=1 Tax=Gotra octocincta TaxID=3029099 RepID=UPI0023D7DFDC|nr:ATP synthase F0 subunit 8 [Gotra octocincta]WDQ40354.1 ATP synthase F0 subunit 8 [Gotra octocincta]